MKQSSLVLALLVLVLFNTPIDSQLTGSIFRDYNWNGVQDSREILITETVRVIVSYNNQNQTVQTQNGTFSVNVPAGTAFSAILDTTSLPSYLQGGYATTSASASTVVFGTAPATVKMSVANLGDYCADDLTTVNIATNCYVFGPQNTTQDVLVSFPYTAGQRATGSGTITLTRVQRPAPTEIARSVDVGTTWGLAYQRSSKQLYAAAFEKRHSGFPRSNNTLTGLIYGMNANSTSPQTYVYIDLEASGINTGAAALDAHNNSNYVNDANAWDKVGKYGLGGLAINDQGTNLYVVNLMSNEVVRILAPAPGSGSSPSVSGRQRVPYPPNCVASDVHAFGIKFKDDKLYVGVVCSAESTQNVTQLYAYVYVANATTLNFTATPVLSFPLNYPRGPAARAGPSQTCTAGVTVNTTYPSGYNLALWRPWAPIISELPLTTDQCYYPQPILCSIAFGDNGQQMIVSFIDRYGHQSGNSKTTPPSGTVSGVSAGEILCASLNPSTGVYTIENNGTCGSNVGGYTYSPSLLTGSRPGAGDNQGPGNGEFFVDDTFAPGEHSEIVIGGVEAIAGSGQVITTVFDPMPTGTAAFRSGGVRFFSEDNGSATQFYMIYSTDQANDTFGKAAGLGDLEPFCAVQPFQIGNRVWYDLNNNGIQDAGETGIANLTIYIQSTNGTIIANTTTSSTGEWYFSSRNGLQPNTNYTVVVPLSSVSNATGGTPTNVSPSSRGNAQLDSTGYQNSQNYQLNVRTGSPGSIDHSFDLGIAPQLTLGDQVWCDSNANGVLDNNETGIANVTVYLYSSTNTLLANTTTNANGVYQFNVSAQSTYYVTVNITSAFGSCNISTFTVNGLVTNPSQNQTFVTVQVSVNTTSRSDVDFGFRQALNLGDFVWIDSNNNGQQDAGELGIANVTVQLLSSSGSQLATTSTNSSGYYNFQVQPNTNYIVQIALSDSSLGGRNVTTSTTGNSTTDSNGVVNGNFDQANVQITNSSDYTIDFGFVSSIYLGDFVWFDANSNGQQDESPAAYGISNVLVELHDANGNLLSTTSTNGTGYYLFTVNPNTNYSVWVSTPNGNIDGDVATYPNQAGVNGSSNSDGYPSGNYSIANVTIATTSNLDIDFGFRPQLYIGDFVWCDTNGNGLQDSGEPGISNVTVVLLNQNGTQIASTTTNNNGFYQFQVSPNSTYVVRVPLSSGSLTSGTQCNQPTIPSQGGNNSTDSNGVSVNNGGSVDATVNVGTQNDTSIDFGFRTQLFLGDYVWCDTNRNGVQDSNETGISGATVTLTSSSGATQTATTTGSSSNTNSNPGYYQFEVQPNTNYTITVQVDTQNSCNIPTQPYQGSSGSNSVGVPSNTSGSATAFVQIGSSSNSSVDFGFTSPQLYIGDFVWCDSNGNGVQDAGEQGIQNANVSLYLVGSTPLYQTTLTNSSGGYQFAVSQNTNYIVTVESAPGTCNVPTQSNSPNATDSTSSKGVPRLLATNVTVSDASVQVGTSSNFSIDFGFTNPPAPQSALRLGDYVWCDLNGDGVQDSNEPGIANVQVTLVSGSTRQFTYTNASGYYYFDAQNNVPYEVQINATASPALAGKIPTRLYGGSTSNDSNGVWDAQYPIYSVARVTLSNNQSDYTIDFGWRYAISIGDFVWCDSNQNGVQDSGELGIPGVELSLLSNGDQLIATTTTDADGYYQFTSPIGDPSVTDQSWDIQPNTPYTVVIFLNSPMNAQLSSKLPSPYLAGGNGDADSNGLLGQFCDGPVIYSDFITGQNSMQSIDFGLIDSPDCTISTYLFVDGRVSGIPLRASVATTAFYSGPAAPGVPQPSQVPQPGFAPQPGTPQPNSAPQPGGSPQVGPTPTLGSTVPAPNPVPAPQLGSPQPTPVPQPGSPQPTPVPQPGTPQPGTPQPTPVPQPGTPQPSVVPQPSPSASGASSASSQNQTGTCITIESVGTGNVEQLDYIVISGLSTDLSSTAVLRSSAYLVNLTSVVRVSSYNGNGSVCPATEQCSAAVPRNATRYPAQEGDLVICVACSEYEFNRGPFEVCFPGVSASSFANTRISVGARSVSGWDCPIEATGVFGPMCDSTATRCNNLTCVGSEVVCEQQCNGNLPVTMQAYSPTSNNVCVYVAPTDGVFIGAVGGLSLSHNVPVTSSVSYTLTDGFGNVYNSSSFTNTSCAACQNSTSSGNNGYQTCFGCLNITAPFTLCFNQAGLNLSSFDRTVVKFTASNVCGFCNQTDIDIVGLLSSDVPCESNNASEAFRQGAMQSFSNYFNVTPACNAPVLPFSVVETNNVRPSSQCAQCSCTPLVQPNCTSFNSYIICDQAKDQCTNLDPVQLYVSSPMPGMTCLDVWPTAGVTVGKIDFISFTGARVPVTASSMISSVTDGYSCDQTSASYFETYQGGNVCSGSYIVNAGNTYDLAQGDLTLCLGGESTTPTSYQISQTTPYYRNLNNPAPARVCFSGVQTNAFTNSVVKVRLSDVSGFCGAPQVRVVALLESTGQNCAPPVPAPSPVPVPNPAPVPNPLPAPSPVPTSAPVQVPAPAIIAETTTCAFVFTPVTTCQVSCGGGSITYSPTGCNCQYTNGSVLNVTSTADPSYQTLCVAANGGAAPADRQEPCNTLSCAACFVQNQPMIDGNFTDLDANNVPVSTVALLSIEVTSENATSNPGVVSLTVSFYDDPSANSPYAANNGAFLSSIQTIRVFVSNTNYTELPTNWTYTWNVNATSGSSADLSVLFPIPAASQTQCNNNYYYTVELQGERYVPNGTPTPSRSYLYNLDNPSTPLTPVGYESSCAESCQSSS